MFLLWSLSQPRNSHIQQKLYAEVLSIPDDALNSNGNPTAEASDRCVYLNAVIKETLRLYAPLPSSEPRSLAVQSEIDGYTLPANTVVGMQPYSLHRNPEVFKDPLTFDPERWLGDGAAEANRWFWAFSSGGRMCVGLQYVLLLSSLSLTPRTCPLMLTMNSLAMAEMTTLTTAIYRKYQTSLAPGFENATPGTTARFEVFFDKRYDVVKVSFLPSLLSLSSAHLPFRIETHH